MEIEFGMIVKVQIADFYTKSVYLRSIYLRSQKSSFAEYRAITAKIKHPEELGFNRAIARLNSGLTQNPGFWQDWAIAIDANAV
jgi:hypothetical protein